MGAVKDPLKFPSTSVETVAIRVPCISSMTVIVRIPGGSASARVSWPEKITVPFEGFVAHSLDWERSQDAKAV